jgi:hypothetical protein
MIAAELVTGRQYWGLGITPELISQFSSSGHTRSHVITYLIQPFNRKHPMLCAIICTSHFPLLFEIKYFGGHQILFICDPLILTFKNIIHLLLRATHCKSHACNFYLVPLHGCILRLAWGVEVATTLPSDLRFSQGCCCCCCRFAIYRSTRPNVTRFEPPPLLLLIRYT